jgi:hypothetical protein
MSSFGRNMESIMFSIVSFLTLKFIATLMFLSQYDAPCHWVWW